MNKIQIGNENLHEIKIDIILDYAEEFELVGSLKVVDQIRQTQIRFRNIPDFVSSIISIVEGFDAEDAIFNDFIYKIKTPQFNSVNRSQYGNGCDFKHEIIEYHGNNCFIPSKG